MTDIGIKGLVTKNVDEIHELATLFIKSSLNIREGIILGEDPEVCMLSLIRDTYMCNLLLRYIGLMTIVNTNPKWTQIDGEFTAYINTYYSSAKFKNKLIELFDYFTIIYERNGTNYDYCKFLDKMINRADLSKKGLEIKQTLTMMENKIFNVLNVNPILKINKQSFKFIPPQFEIKADNVVVHLTQTNYLELLDCITDLDVLHSIEDKYMSRTKNILPTFSNLIIERQKLAENTGYGTFFKYINRGKSDISDTLKDFLTELNNKVNTKIQTETMKIYQSHIAVAKTNVKSKLMSRCDVLKQVRSKKSTIKFDLNKVFSVIFDLLNRYFNIVTKKIDSPGWSDKVTVFVMTDKTSSKLLGRLYVDLAFDENKRVINPISIRLADKMQINQSGRTVTELALLANIPDSNGLKLTYSEIVYIFREFGYVVSNMCYDTRVGLINYDDEFSNFMPAFMECLAWDIDVIKQIVGSKDRTIVDHIEMMKNIDICYNMKLKCINAKFDHLLHNSEPLIEIISNAVKAKKDASYEILETYQTIYSDIMEPIGNMINTDIGSIDPIVIIQEINRSQGLLYSNLMNEIFSYATYWIVKNELTSVEKFRQILLDNGVDNYRELIRSFLKNTDINCFTLYVKNVLKIDVVDDFVTEDTNYFDENIENSDEDIDEIISIKRI